MSTDSAMPVMVIADVVEFHEIRAAISFWLQKKTCTDGFSLCREASKLADVYGEMIVTGLDTVSRDSIKAETLGYLQEVLDSSAEPTN